MSLYVFPQNPHEHSPFCVYKLCMQSFVATDRIFVATVCKQNAPRREDLPEPTRLSAEGQYQGMIFTLCALGGDWLRDSGGKHRVFLMGESSRDTDEYINKED